MLQAFEAAKPVSPTRPLVLNEIHPDEEQPPSSHISNASVASEASTFSKDSIVSHMSNTTASVTSTRTADFPIDSSEATEVAEKVTSSRGSPSGSLEVSVVLPPSSTAHIRTPFQTPLSDRRVINTPETPMASSKKNGAVSTDQPSIATIAETPPIDRKSSVIDGAAHASSISSNTAGNTDIPKHRKVSSVSQSNGSSTPKREVYV